MLLLGEKMLSDAGIEEAKSDAGILFEHFTGYNRSKLFTDGNNELSSEIEKDYLEAIDRRKKHIPVQYITGVQNFMGFDFFVNENVLIPRFDTEILVEKVLNHIKKINDKVKLLDICTGSACIALSTILLSKDLEAVASDISKEALLVANRNKEKLGVNNITFINTDLLDGLESKYRDYFDVIVSNPPYIETGVIETLSKEVKEHEPMLALDGGSDGLIFYRRIVNEGLVLLKNGGLLAVEIGYNQGDLVKELFLGAGLKNVLVIKDYAGLDRVVTAIK